jgi:hypothetical protein
MLRDEIALFTKLSGRDGEHTPIGIIGAYLDGYYKGYENGMINTIRSIEKQYSEHNELVPSWIHIGGMLEADNDR